MDLMHPNSAKHAVWLVNSSCLYFTSVKIQAHTAIPSIFYRSVWDLNFGSHVRVASPLLSEPFPQPPGFNLIMRARGATGGVLGLLASADLNCICGQIDP